eukprot:gnl/TRDRNA2_/TRDRNA2_80927_c0_seq1.p1 gnl/TRDRNA2_/TRDRNA2_80927_c0~~gnl/TRDRNA2_/TRDRNA2_80927_c0_seq1.p1  ORF type:complete len:705 (+),score=150.49 gnl/TRDRNA2_/TRDRNA2_80927_c0_seq1:69-2117(+)
MAAAGATSAPSPVASTPGAPAVPGVPGAAGTASTALSKKIQKALTLRVDSQTSRDALKCLSGFFDENTVHTRRNLRSTIEGQNLLLHQEFVDSFGGLERKIEALETLVKSLDTACERAESELHRSRSETQSILEKAAGLRNESKVIEEKQQVLAKFLERFRLSEADTQLMKSADRPIDADFFEAFSKLERVRSNARQMLSSCGQQTSGVDILHETSELLEASYERLFVWVQQQCRGPKSASVTKSSSQELDTPAGATLKRALTLLNERPVYFNHCVRDIAKVRRQALMQRFFEALSQGDGPGTRPIELQACDPVRYVGDMLAWIHESVASEREAIATLMGKLPASRGGSAPSEAEAADSKPAMDGEPELALVGFEDILDYTLEGLVAPFSARARQVVEAQASIVIVYRVAQVFSFFVKTLEDVLQRKDACLVVLCKDLHARTHQAFLDAWDTQAQKLRQGVVGVYVSDLSAPSFVTEAVGTLSEVLSIYESAPVLSEEREVDFLPILSAAFDPLLNHCQQVAAMMDHADGQVFLINCVASMQAPLRKHDFTAQRVAMYAAILDEYVQLLVDGQASAVLQKLGLAERLKALREKAPDAPLSAVPELHPVSLSATLRSFYNSLFTLGGVLALPLLERISSRSLRSEARTGVARLIGSAYEELYEGVKELGVATHTPDQVRTLLE